MARPITLFTGQWADLPFEEVARLAGEWGYDGLEIACWGDHLDVSRWDDAAYVQSRLDILERNGLSVFAISNPPAKQRADVNIARRGPTLSSQRPNAAADKPRNTIAVLKTQPIVLSFQSPGAESLPPRSRESGRLNTLNAYACPMDRWIASAAGGTSQREKCASAIECSRSRNDMAADNVWR